MDVHEGVLVANGVLEWRPALGRRCRDAGVLIAADGGANHLARLGVRPRWVVGDLDSIRPSVRAWIGEDRLVERRDQDRTDLDKAVSFATEDLGLERVTVLGALGGRLDHQIGNLSLLAALGRGDRLVFLEEHTLVMAVSGHRALSARPGETWALWTLDPAVRVSAHGLRWSFDDAALNLRPSTSNVADAPEISITAHGGAVLVCRHLADEHPQIVRRAT